MKSKLAALAYALTWSALIVGALTGCRENKKQPASPGDEPVTAFVNVNLVPMTEEKVIENQTVLVQGKQIVAIGSAEKVSVPENATVIEGAGAYLMPGLADMHVHTKDDWLSDVWPVGPLNLFLANGVTTIKDMGPHGSSVTNALSFALGLQDDINAGKLDGPTLYTSGLRSGHSGADPEQDPREIVRENYAQGFDFLKVYSYLSKQEFQQVMAVAKELGMYTSGHIPHTVGLEGVLAAGMDEIAHIEELDWEFIVFDRDQDLQPEEWAACLIGAAFEQYNISASFDAGDFERKNKETLASTISKLQSARIPICTTIIVSDLIVQKLFEPKVFLARPELKYMPQEYLDSFRQGTEKHQVSLRGIENAGIFKYGMDKILLVELHRAGIPLLLATDTGSASMGIVPGFSVHDELRIMVENGFTPFEAMATGTVNAGKAVEKMTGEEGFGVIEVGKRADLILVSGNPLDDVAHIRQPLGVMAAGKWYAKETLAQMVAIED